jgi:hypothetical protein
MAWQAAAGVTPAAGYFGPKSRAAFGSTTSTGPSMVPAGTGLTVMAGVQPANSLAPKGAMRVPFTRITLTAGNDGDVTVTGVVVQRTGLASDSVFAGVILVDEATGKQIGTSKTFNSNHQATVGETMVLARGTSRSFLIAGNMASSLTSHSGEAPAISVVGVNTSATVSGSLPIMGAFQTTNDSLTTGTVTFASSNAFATNASSTQNLGATGYKFTGFRLTASSAEDLLVRSIRVNQVGSVSGSDLANVAIVVDGVSYPASVSADGKYYEASLGSGKLVTKGNQVEVYVVGDLAGSNSSGRTVQFHVDKSSDIYATGVTYGYGAAVSGGSAGTPFFYGMTVTVAGASVTTIEKSNTNTGAAQNVAINVSNQPLGSFVVDIKGESITTTQMIFTVASSSGSAGGPITNITLVDENGTVIAGPVDESSVASGGNGITFTDTVTFPTGKHVYALRGKIASATTNGATVTVSTNPSSLWSNVKGNLTGNSISLSQGSFAMNAMTVKAGTITIGRNTSPASQIMVAGGTGVLMVNFVFDATQSGEDVRFASAPVRLRGDESGATLLVAAPSNLSNCQLFNGTTALNTGSNSLSPTQTSTTTSATMYTSTITLDNPVVVAKGTQQNLGMHCNIASGSHTNSTFSWDVQDVSSNWSFTGATSNGTITGADATDSTVAVTIGAGTVSVATDAASPGYTIATAGSTGVTAGAYRLRATNENVMLTKLGVSLAASTTASAASSASSTASDVTKVSIYDGTTKVGEAFFTGTAQTATSSLSTPVTLVMNTDKTLTVKVDLAVIGTGQPSTFSGHLIKVDYVNGEGTGVGSGSTYILGTKSGSPGGSTAVAGVRVFKSYPTFSQDALPTGGASDGRLLRFKVTANAAGPVGLTQFQFTISTSTSGTLVSGVNLFGFTDANYSQPITGVSTGGQFLTSNLIAASCPGPGGQCAASPNLNIGAQTAAGASTTVQVPAGGTLYFELRGSVTTVTGSSIVTTLLGDSAYMPMIQDSASDSNALRAVIAMNFLENAASTTAFAFGTVNFSNGRLVWSPNSTSTAARNDTDWTNGFGLPGLPSSGVIQSRSN